jgi:uncharacterized protein DUF2442
MNYPKIQSVTTFDTHTLLITFNNGEKKKYDISSFLEKEMFAPLKDPVLFRNIKVEAGGYAVSWNNEIDISEFELWKNGQDTV